MKNLVIIISLILSTINAQVKNEYPDNDHPGTTAKIFGKGFMPYDKYIHSTPTFSPDKKEMYFSRFFEDGEKIVFSKKINGEWTILQLADFKGYSHGSNPKFTPDGEKLFFSLARQLPGLDKKQGRDLWFVERKDNGWSKPKPFNYVSKGFEERASFSAEGKIYFREKKDIVYCNYGENKTQNPVKLSDEINSEDGELGACVALDDSFIIFTSSRDGGYSGTDLYISFKDENGEWTEAKNMGEKVNWANDKIKGTRFPMLSPDEKFLFFSKAYGRKDTLFWISTDIIKELK